MILSDKTIKRMMAIGEIEIGPLTEESIQPASIDLRISDNFSKMTRKHLSQFDYDKFHNGGNNHIRYTSFTEPRYTIFPGDFVLATTIEKIKLPPDVGAFVQGRSSIGRLGVFVENAGWVDPGFEGELTLELCNASSIPINLKKGCRICQLVLCSLDQPCENAYNGKYQNQKGATGSLFHKDIQ